MRNVYSLLAACLLVTLALASCQNSGADTNPKPSSNAAAPAVAGKQETTTPADGVKRISIDDARVALDKGTAIMVDVRDPNAYKSSHIKGSINIPGAQVGERSQELPKDKTIILYCS